MTTETTAAPSCRSCGSYLATRRDGLCTSCGHAVDAHGATVANAYAVECPRETAACMTAWVRASETLDTLLARS